MMWLLHWVLNAVALLIVAHFVEGFEVNGFVSALVAVVIIGLLNATLGLLLKIITLPLGILTFRRLRATGLIFDPPQFTVAPPNAVAWPQNALPIAAAVRSLVRAGRVLLEKELGLSPFTWRVP